MAAASAEPAASASEPPAEATPSLQDASADPVVAGVLERFVRQYEAKDTAEQDAVIDESYSPDAVFDDNLLHVKGTANIKVQFHAVAKLFKSCKISIQSSTVEPAGEKFLETLPGARVIKVYNIQDYAVGSREIKIECDTTFTINSEGKIVDHMDKWRNRWANFGFLKRFGGSTTSALMKALKY